MLLHLSLDKSVPLAFHWSRADALGLPPPNKQPARVIFEVNARLMCYVTAGGTLPDVAVPGDTLSGHFYLAKLAAESLGASREPEGFPVALVVPPQPNKDQKKEDGAEENGMPHPESEAALAHAVRGLKIKQLAMLATALGKAKTKEKASAEAESKGEGAVKGDTASIEGTSAVELASRYAALFAELETECHAAAVEEKAKNNGASSFADEQCLALYSQALADAEANCGRKDSMQLCAVIKASNRVCDAIDTGVLAGVFGLTLDKDDKEQVKARKCKEAEKKALVNALHLKAVACADRHSLAALVGDEETETRLEELDAAVRSLHKWAAPSEHSKLYVQWHKAHGRFALALGVLQESFSANKKAPPSKENLELQAELIASLGWSHWAEGAKAVVRARYPTALPLTFDHELK